MIKIFRLFMDSFDRFVANLFKARPLIEDLAIALKEYNSYSPDFSYTFEYPYPDGEMNKLRFDREHMERYLRFSREIPDEIVAKNLREFNGNIEYTLQNVFVILLKYWRELAYLYKARDLAQQKLTENINIEYTFKNPFHRFTNFSTETKKYTGTTLVYFSNSVEGEFVDIFRSFKDGNNEEGNNEEGNNEDGDNADVEMEDNANIRMIITRERN